MPVRSLAHTLEELKVRPFWRLLGADHAPAYMAILRLRLLDAGGAVPASTLHSLVERDLELLNASDFNLTNTAKEYVREWVNKKWIVRRLPDGAREEEYELSSEAAAAIRFACDLNERKVNLTESRLATVLHQLENLVEATDANPDTRRRRLEAERSRIESELHRLDHSTPRTLPPETACERLRDILSLTLGLPDEFLHVRNEIERLHLALRERIVAQSGSSGEILDTVFQGVEEIEDTPAGRSFNAFWRMLTDPRQRHAIDAAIEQLAERPMLTEVGDEDWRFLSRLTGTLMERAARVNEVIRNFSHSLRQFVQSREFREQRALRRLLDEARTAALELKESFPPQMPLDDSASLLLTSADVDSIGAWVLLDPEESVVDTKMPIGDASDLDPETIKNWIDRSDIDWESLERQIETVLKSRTVTTVAGILGDFPARQGLGSVVGLLALAFRHNADPDPDGIKERVEWLTENGAVQAATIPRFFFTRSPPE